MCTRYYLEQSPELGPISDRTKRLRLTQDMIAKLGRPLKTEGVVRPNDMVPVIAPDKSGNRKEFPMIWGFHVEGIEKPIINARVENAKDNSTFKKSWESWRCVIPGAYNYEWSRVQTGGTIKPKDQYVIQPVGATVTWFAGLYRIEEGYMGFKYPVFTILTRPATPELKKIHDRMPVMLDIADIDTWIRPGKPDKKMRAMAEMIVEKV